MTALNTTIAAEKLRCKLNIERAKLADATLKQTEATARVDARQTKVAALTKELAALEAPAGEAPKA